MTQIQSATAPQYSISANPSYNAVKIDIHNPQVNTPAAQNPIKKPENSLYDCPKCSVYDAPKQSIYEAKKEAPVTPKTPASVKEVPSVPAPVITQAATETKGTDEKKSAPAQ